MQHVDESLTRFEPKLIKYIYQDAFDEDAKEFTCEIAVMEESSRGRYVRYSDVVKFLEIIAKKVRIA